MATLPLAEYAATVSRMARASSPETASGNFEADAVRMYRWDDPRAAVIKYLINVALPEAARDDIVDELFRQHVGDERELAGQLYLTWDEARSMQAAGMVIGGHSHLHMRLGGLSEAEQRGNIAVCAEALRNTLHPQDIWPFAYPYGDYTAETMQIVAEHFTCAFTTESGVNDRSRNRYALRRFDTNDLPQERSAAARRGNAGPLSESLPGEPGPGDENHAA
jgi:hypothetical protein